MDTALAHELRAEPRSNIFVIATLYASGGSTPVRIRNISRMGALIEAAALPPCGEAVRLSRGSLSVAGQVVWAAGPRAGLHFTSHVAVADWLPSGQRGSGQQLVDELVHQARLGAVPQSAPAAPAPSSISPTPDELSKY